MTTDGPREAGETKQEGFARGHACVEVPGHARPQRIQRRISGARAYASRSMLRSLPTLAATLYRPGVASSSTNTVHCWP